MQKLNRIPVILAALSLGAEMALNLFGSNSNFVLLWLTIVFLFLQVVILYFELESIKNVRPNLVLHGLPYKDTRNLMDIQSEHFRPEYFHVSFENSPKAHTEQATARGVIARLTYFNDRRQLIAPINGRWADTPQPSTLPPLSPTRPLLPVDFESSGLEHYLTVAMKHQEDDTIYAVNNDCYYHPAWKVPGFAMNEQKIFVRVRLTGENVDEIDFWLLLESDKGDWNITLTEPLNIPG